MLYVSDLGIAYQLNALVAKYGADALNLHLFQNNYTPSDSSVIGDFTEATFDGYAAETLSGWTSASVTAHVATSNATPIAFVKTGSVTSNNIYGYYVTNSANTVMYWAERDGAAPIVMNANGDTYTVTVRDTQQSLV